MSDDVPSDGPDSRRALLAVVAVLGLVAASTAAPVLAGETPLGGLDSPEAPSEAPEFLSQFDGLRDLLGNDQPDVNLEGAAARSVRSRWVTRRRSAARYPSPSGPGPRRRTSSRRPTNRATGAPGRTWSTPVPAGSETA